ASVARDGQCAGTSMLGGLSRLLKPKARDAWIAPDTEKSASGYQALGIQPGRGSRLLFRLVDRGDGFAECVALDTAFLCRRDGFDATPLLSGLGFDLAHFVAGMVAAAVIAVNVRGCGHGGI
ncbi:MAG: hypothetical protein K9J43_06285, partial [Polynucleobacter sp.]|nr:hypothetical protein [Polynucleobacter sp.]